MRKKAKRFNQGGGAEYSPELRDPANMEPGLEGVYPETWLPIGRIAKGVRSAADMAMRPTVKNAIHPMLPGRSIETAYVQRHVRDPAELEAIRKSGYMLPKEGGTQKYFTAVNEARTAVPEGSSMLRVAREKVPANKAVRRKDVEVFNPESNAFEPLKKGGKVSLKRRGDGIAKRGRTKGRVV